MTSSQLNIEETQEVKRPLNFSIDHILNNAGKSKGDNCDGSAGHNFSMVSLPWLHCTRYCPPKIPRRKDPPQRRQLGRHPRIPFTTYQLSVLEEHFKRSPYLSSQEVKEVSRKLDLADIRVKIWFQNRRARERRERGAKQTEQIEKSIFKYSQSNQSPSKSPEINTSPSIPSSSKPLQVPVKYSNFTITNQLKVEPPKSNFSFIEMKNNFHCHL